MICWPCKLSSRGCSKIPSYHPSPFRSSKNLMLGVLGGILGGVKQPIWIQTGKVHFLNKSTFWSSDVGLFGDGIMSVPLLVYILVDILYRISVVHQHPGNLEQDVSQFYQDTINKGSIKKNIGRILFDQPVTMECKMQVCWNTLWIVLFLGANVGKLVAHDEAKNIRLGVENWGLEWGYFLIPMHPNMSWAGVLLCFVVQIPSQDVFGCLGNKAEVWPHVPHTPFNTCHTHPSKSSGNHKEIPMRFRVGKISSFLLPQTHSPNVDSLSFQRNPG